MVSRFLKQLAERRAGIHQLSRVSVSPGSFAKDPGRTLER
jgi:hypothetical protein